MVRLARHLFALSVWASLWALALPGQAAGLADAPSPYLRAHAGDAIKWRVWGQSSLAQARRENKLIFLSIGYSSCHWCHVQSRTTFKDPRVVERLNLNYIAILVDRETRPDIDHHYMAIMQAMTGKSGWPANFFLTPDGLPIFAGSYMTADAEHGSPGFIAVAGDLAAAWSSERQSVLATAREISAEIDSSAGPVSSDAPARGPDPRSAGATIWAKRFDDKFGGFGWGAKFLHPNVLSFLLRHGVRTNDKALLARVYRTLDQMAAGGVRDHLGGAFHRYSVDRFWQVPHFEIALNENALLARLYLEAYQASAKSHYAAIARGILDDLLDRFRLGEGGFAAALDADSEGKEGFFYTWREAEVRAVLAEPAASLFLDAYVDRKYGLLKGRSVIRLSADATTLPEALGNFAASRAKLLAARRLRPPPLRDEKILTDWNALTISAFAKAGQVLDDPRYRRVALAENRRLLAAVADGSGPISHAFFSDRTDGNVFLDDYAFAIEALLDLYETDFAVSRLDTAARLMLRLIERFSPRPAGLFQFTPPKRSTGIPPRAIANEDGAPSGNAAALAALNRLVLFGATGNIEEHARAVTDDARGFLAKMAASAPGLLQALDYAAADSHEIVIVGRLDDPRTQAMLREVRSRLLPGAVVALIPPDLESENKKWPLLSGRPLLENRPTAYVCRQRLCKLPVDRPAELAAQLDGLFQPGSAQ